MTSAVSPPGTTSETSAEPVAVVDREPPGTASTGYGGRPPLRAAGPGRGPWWSRLLGSTRARVVALYLVLLVVAAVLIVFGIRQVLTIRLSDRTEEALRQEVLELTQLVEDGRDPLTGQPFDSLDRAFNVYLDRNVPNIEEAFLAFVGPDLLRDRLRSFPGRQIPTDALALFADFSTGSGESEMIGSFDTDHGEARYRAVRVSIGGDTGAFVVTILPEAGRREIRELQTYGLMVMLGVIVLSGVFAWFLAGRVLAPVRRLTETARSISDDDRSGRIPVSGTSETVEMAETFNEMLDRLEDSHQSQLEFLRAAGHELRTPLTVATGHLELLGDSREERQTTIPIVLDELSRMGRIVDDLQSLAESVHPDFIIRREFDLRPLARDLLAKASALGPRDWQLDAATAGAMVGDRDRLVEAALNLADNAVKNSDPGDTIGIGVAREYGEVRLWVRDTGVGITGPEQGRVFQRFVRGEGAGRRYRGAGLGLSVVTAIAEAHGGRVELESEPGQGSRFTIVIPQGRP